MMDTIDLSSKQRNISALLHNHSLFAAFKAIRELIASTESWELDDKLSQLESSYRYMIQFFISGTDDPQKSKIYHNIINELYSLTDRAIYLLSQSESSEQIYISKRLLPKSITCLENAYSNYLTRKSELSLILESQSGETDKSSLISKARDLEIAEEYLFNYVWSKFPVSNQEIGLLKNIFSDESVKSQLKILLIAAIYLNVCKFYQESYLTLLLNVFAYNSDINVRIPALCCAILLLAKHSNRVQSSANISNAIKSIDIDEQNSKNIQAIFFILIRSLDTEKLNKRVQDELMPEIMKLSPDIIKKFKPGFQGELSDFESNPEWKNILDDSGLTKKIDELNEIQMEGGDLFMSTFAHLKSFPFFYKAQNWFRPFDQNNSVVLESFSEKDKLMMDLISSSKMLCDSDKYSFCLSLQSIPASQKDIMAAQFSEQNAAIQELKRSSILTDTDDSKNIANNFIKDLFRFSKLFRYKSEFYDPFILSIDLPAHPIFNLIAQRDEALTLAGEYFLKNEHYHEAVGCFKAISDNGDGNKSLLQKIGFCHQCLKEYGKALDEYSKSELINPDNIWNLKHIAICYKATGNTAKALEYYKKAESLSPDNLSVCMSIGHCLLELGNTEEALKYYYKVDYLDGKGSRAIRPIAWCTFLSGNYNQSHTYYDKVLNDAPTPQDYLNIGHLYLCEKEYAKALEYYSSALSGCGNDLSSFKKMFDCDKPYLLEKGLTELDLILVLDKLSYDLNNSQS